MGEPVGEDAWVSLVDEGSRNAANLDQRIAVIESYKRALHAEPCSLRLWLQYCEWMWSLHTDCQSSDAGWSEEEQLMGREIFSLQTALHLWLEGAHAVRWRLDDSHVLWNRYMSIELEELAKRPTHEGIQKIKNKYLDRLQQPHATWAETSSAFSGFLSRYDEPHWEEMMAKSTKLAQAAKDIYSQREYYEDKVKMAKKSGDAEQLKTAITQYQDFETRQAKGHNGIPQLLFAFYERALLLIPTDTGLWEDYITAVNTFLSDPKNNPQDATNLLDLIDRSVKHCPWSGALWSRYIIRAEIENLAFRHVEGIKHAATSSGQLDRNGMDDVLLVYAAWCHYLRRRATGEHATEEDGDLADVGMPSALESVKHWGERLKGRDWHGDPQFHIERCWIQYLTQKNIIDEARQQWHNLVKTHGDHYEFWQRYYQWEMMVPHNGWGRPHATHLLRQAIARRTLDWPEKLIEVYLLHAETFEPPREIASAIDFVHRNLKGVQKRRQREAAAAAAEQARVYEAQLAAAAPVAVQAETTSNDSPGSAKRKHEQDTTDGADAAFKKVKIAGDEQSSQHLKRDRENTSVIVTNLPLEVTQTKVRQYFREYGHINNLSIKKESNGNSSAALIEFRSIEDAQSALLRDGKYFVDHQIEVKPGTGLTLYVTNFPPTADEEYIRKLFKSCGEIFSIRWPSLKYNTHRRFCYVSFRTPEAAAAATKMDGKLLENKYKLDAKYSNPGQKKNREGAANEGREMHIGNLDKMAVEEDVKSMFSKYGTVESVRILRNVTGKSKGAAFVVMSTKEEAEKAVAELDKAKFMSQVMAVEIAETKNFKPTATTTGSVGSASPGPSVNERDEDGDSKMHTDLPAASGPQGNLNAGGLHAPPNPSKEGIQQRTITLLGVPDTVNDSRIRALCQPHGHIVKLTLRPDHSGAIIEYSSVDSAGKAALALEGHEIIPGRRLRTGDLSDLFGNKEEIRTDRIQIGVGKKASSLQPASALSTTGAQLQSAAPIRRPQAARGGRGGLGAKRGLGFPGAARKPASLEADGNGNGEAGAKAENGDKGKPPKSNADFKAIFLAGKPVASGSNAEAVQVGQNGNNEKK